MKSLKLFLLGLVGVLLCITACSKDDDDKSSAKEIKSFQIISLNPVVNGSIDEKAKTISVTVPYGSDVKAMKTKIIVSDKATVNPASETVCDFTNAYPFVVTAEDGTTATYVVTVRTSTNGGEGGEGGNEQQKVLNGTMSENTTLKDLGLPIDYVIDGPFFMDGNACLTIEAGVTIAFTGEGSYIHVGENAGLKVLGEKEKPVMFTGPINNKNKGSWGYIEFTSKRNDNQLKNVIFENGGSRDAVIYLTNAKVAIDSCTIDGSLGNGIYASSSEISSFTGNTIKNCDGAPIESNNLEAYQNVKEGNVYSNNNENVLKLTNRVSIADMKNKKAVLKHQGIPYLLELPIDVDNASELTIEPGVTIQMAADGFIEATGASSIIMEGTAEKPINITSNSEKVYNRGIWVQDKCIASIKNVNISMTYDNQAIYISDDYTDVTLENVNISKCRNYGVYFNNETNSHMKFSQKNVTFSDCADGNIYHNNKGEAVSEFATSYPIVEQDAE